MDRFNLDKEWKFIIKETHRDKSNPKNVFRREMIFYMQIFLSKSEIGMYKYFKDLYLNAEIELIERFSQLMMNTKFVSCDIA
jgi:hypothetical protein